MKLITAVVRPERLPQLKAALFQVGVTGITISQVDTAAVTAVTADAVQCRALNQANA